MRAYNANTFQLSSKAKEILLKFSTSHSLPASFVFRSKIALLASEGRSNPQISAETRIAYTTVCTWRNRFYNSAELIIQAEECTEPDESSVKLEKTIKSILSNEQVPAAKPVFTPEQTQLIHELASKNPKDFGWKLSQWNLPALAAEAARQGIVEFVSPDGIQGLLTPVAAP